MLSCIYYFIEINSKSSSNFNFPNTNSKKLFQNFHNSPENVNDILVPETCPIDEEYSTYSENNLYVSNDKGNNNLHEALSSIFKTSPTSSPHKFDIFYLLKHKMDCRQNNFVFSLNF